VAVLVAVAIWGSIEVPSGPAAGRDVGGPPTTTAPADRLRIGSFNIHGGRGTDGQSDLARTAAALEAVDLDVVALQEVIGPFPNAFTSHDQASLLGERLAVAHLFAPTERRWWRDSFGNGLLTRVPIEAWQRIPLASPGGSGERNLLLTEARAGGRRVRVLATHIDRQRPHDAQLRTAIALFRMLEPPVVLLGDLNTRADHPILRSLTDDAAIENPLREHVPDLSPAHIDWVFARGLDSTAAGVGPTGASDHPLVWAEFDWRGVAGTTTRVTSP